MNHQVAVLGTFQSEFKTHVRERTYTDQVEQAAIGVFRDSGIYPDDIDAVVVSLAPTFFMGVADADRWAVDYFFCEGKPIFRVHTGGTTGGSAVHAAYNLVRSGMARSVLIIGAERIAETPDAQEVLNLIFDPFYERDMPLSTNSFVALRAASYMKRHKISQEDLARVVVRARKNAKSNPYAHLKGDVTVEDVMASPMIAYPLKRFEVCPRSSGSAAMIIGNQEMARKSKNQPAFINGVGSISDTYWLGDRVVPTGDTDFIQYDLIRQVAEPCYRMAGISDPLRQIQVTELYDPYSIHTPVSLEQLGFCSPGTALRLEKDGYWNRDSGIVAVNPSGGTLCSNPIAITGLVRAIDAANQVMNKAGDMQVKNVKNALATSSGGTAQFYNCTVFGLEPFNSVEK